MTSPAYLRDVAIIAMRAGTPILDRVAFVDVRQEEEAIATMSTCTRLPPVATIAADIERQARESIAKMEARGFASSILASNGETVPNVRFDVVAGAIVHAWRLGAIVWREDETPTLQTPEFTLFRGAGDCKDHSSTGAAILTCLGIPTALVPMGRTAEDPSHMTLAILNKRPSPLGVVEGPIVLPWQPFDGATPREVLAWSETTIAAKFMEDPARAAVRLGVLDHLDPVS
ncbi:MAG: hypothetical protein NVS3B10_18280 [Polyangiales bacterium]